MARWKGSHSVSRIHIDRENHYYVSQDGRYAAIPWSANYAMSPIQSSRFQIQGECLIYAGFSIIKFLLSIPLASLFASRAYLSPHWNFGWFLPQSQFWAIINRISLKFPHWTSCIHPCSTVLVFKDLFYCYTPFGYKLGLTQHSHLCNVGWLKFVESIIILRLNPLP